VYKTQVLLLSRHWCCVCHSDPGVPVKGGDWSDESSKQCKDLLAVMVLWPGTLELTQLRSPCQCSLLTLNWDGHGHSHLRAYLQLRTDNVFAYACTPYGWSIFYAGVVCVMNIYSIKYRKVSSMQSKLSASLIIISDHFYLRFKFPYNFRKIVKSHTICHNNKTNPVISELSGYILSSVFFSLDQNVPV